MVSLFCKAFSQVFENWFKLKYRDNLTVFSTKNYRKENRKCYKISQKWTSLNFTLIYKRYFIKAKATIFQFFIIPRYKGKGANLIFISDKYSQKRSPFWKYLYKLFQIKKIISIEILISPLIKIFSFRKVYLRDVKSIQKIKKMFPNIWNEIVKT